MIPDKCPKCGEAAWRSDSESTDYECGSSIRSSDPTLLRTTLDELDPCAVKALERQRDQLAATLEAQRRGAANAERMLCEALGVESGADVLDAIAGLRERVKRLEEYAQKLETAGDTLATVTLRNGRSHEQWHKAKEAKP